jgi:hypothetical protein
MELRGWRRKSKFKRKRRGLRYPWMSEFREELGSIESGRMRKARQ